MSIQLIDNFKYSGRRFLDGRQQVDSLALMRAVPVSSVPDGFLAYCRETRLWYDFDSSRDDDPSTGRWRPFSAGGSTVADAEAITADEINNLFKGGEAAV